MLHARPAGKYELCAVLTHKGRSADSGHYVSWVKQDDGSWVQFDDDQLIPRKVMLWGATTYHREGCMSTRCMCHSSASRCLPQLIACNLICSMSLCTT